MAVVRYTETLVRGLSTFAFLFLTILPAMYSMWQRTYIYTLSAVDHKSQLSEMALFWLYFFSSLDKALSKNNKIHIMKQFNGHLIFCSHINVSDAPIFKSKERASPIQKRSKKN